MCRSSAAVKLLASESDGRGFESRRQLFFLSFFFFFFFFFFFSNIHTSDKLEIFFDHSILVNGGVVNGVDPWGVHRFLGGINHENGIYYPTALSRVQITRETSTNIPRYCTVIWTVGYFVLYKTCLTGWLPACL